MLISKLRPVLVAVFTLVAFFSLSQIPVAQAKVEAVIGDVNLNGNENLMGPTPSTNANEIIISRKQYVISYNPERRAPNWVAWKVEAGDMGTSGRANDFVQDPDLEKYLSAKGQHAVAPDEYKGSCYDRGHQAPSADRTSNSTDNQATFMMSNMIPQTAYLNRIVWEHLEHYTRQLVQQGKHVYVIAGPIYDQDFGAIGPNKDIPVPSKDFKIIVVLDEGQTVKDINSQTQVISVVMPNLLQDGSQPTDHEKLCSALDLKVGGDSTDWMKYETPVANIEKMSALTIPQWP